MLQSASKGEQSAKLKPNKRQFHLLADEASPLAVAMARSESQTLDMVRLALASQQMRLAYQPAVYANHPEIIGFYEGYIRLLNPQGLVIPASDFMAAVETQELGREIDVAALQLGLLALRRNPGIRVAINMSARSLGYRPWVQMLRSTLRANPGLGSGLILEINEESIVQMPDVMGPFVDEMRDHGIALTLDDFGAGLTSLQMLADFQFDIAKIDGKFIRNCHLESANQAVVQACIGMARAFDMFLVAEAVETPEEAEWLRTHGVGCLQGYLFGKPEVTPDFSKFRAARVAS